MDDHIDADGPGGNPAARAAGSPEPASDESEASLDFTGEPIDAVARSLFVDNVPVEVGDSYGPKDLVVLRSMLSDPAEFEHDQTIVTLIGLLSDGSDEDAALLSAFADAHRDSAAALAAVLGLGYVAERGSKTAMKYLATQAKGQSSPMRDVAIEGLGLSGKPDARALLQQLAKTAVKMTISTDVPAVGLDDRRQAGAVATSNMPDSSLVAESLSVNETIATVGRRAYYGR